MKEISSLSYRSEEMDLSLVEKAIKNIIKKGFGCTSAIITFELNWKYLGKEYAVLNGQAELARYAEVEAYKYVNDEPILCPAVMKIINTYFNMYYTRDYHYYYYAPKSTLAKQVQNWLEDEFIGTMENPAY